MSPNPKKIGRKSYRATPKIKAMAQVANALLETRVLPPGPMIPTKYSTVFQPCQRCAKLIAAELDYCKGCQPHGERRLLRSWY